MLSFNPLGGGAGSGSCGRCNDWPDMSLGSGFPYPPENGTKLGSLSLAPGSPGKRKRRDQNRLRQVVKKEEPDHREVAQEHDKEPGGNRRPGAVPFIPLESKRGKAGGVREPRSLSENSSPKSTSPCQ